MNERTDTSEWPQLRLRVNPAVWEPWLALIRSEIPQAGVGVTVDAAVSLALKVRAGEFHKQGAESLLARINEHYRLDVAAGIVQALASLEVDASIVVNESGEAGVSIKGEGGQAAKILRMPMRKYLTREPA